MILQMDWSCISVFYFELSKCFLAQAFFHINTFFPFYLVLHFVEQSQCSQRCSPVRFCTNYHVNILGWRCYLTPLLLSGHPLHARTAQSRWRACCEGLLQRKARVVEGGVVILQKLHPSHARGCHFHERTVVNCQAVAGDERPHQMQPAQRRWSCGEKDDSDVMVLHSCGDGRGRFLSDCREYYVGIGRNQSFYKCAER